MPPSLAKLPNDAVESSGHALRSPDLVFLAGRVPVKFQGPSLRAMREETPQRQTHLDAIDPRVRAARHPCTQDMQR